jgi:hypothetical protein
MVGFFLNAFVASLKPSPLDDEPYVISRNPFRLKAEQTRDPSFGSYFAAVQSRHVVSEAQNGCP